MPDPLKQTVSATEASALFGVSPYLTSWMLFQRFANGMLIESDANARMDWGSRMQPLLIEQAGRDLRLEVHPNEQYARRGLLGCTRDAEIICPDRGPGALETKVVFDYSVWMSTWDGGKRPPRHIELQTQVQMMVGDGTTPFKWGVISAWLAGEMHYFEREPIPALWAEIERQASQFFDDVRAGREPDPFGSPVENDLLKQVYPTRKGNPLDLSNDPAGMAAILKVAEYQHAKENEGFSKKQAEALKAQLFALAKDHDEVILPHGASIKIAAYEIAEAIIKRKAHTRRDLKPFVPENALNIAHAMAKTDAINDDILMAG